MMADEADLAEERMRGETEMRVKALRGRLGRPDEGRATCIDCGLEIPQARRLALPSCQRCVDCQDQVEGA